MHSFTFNGHSSEEFGIRIERFPNLNRSERKYKSASVAGRNGNIYQMQNAWEEVVVSYQIFAGELAAGAAVTDFTDIVEWLNSADDYAVLMDTYDPEHYRLAVFVDELEIESQWHTFGKATVRFRCRPQRFIKKVPWDNVLPKMPQDTAVGPGVTISVDANGIATMSGTASSNYTMQFNITPTFTFTNEMVGFPILLHNTESSGASFRLYNSLLASLVLEIPMDEINKKIKVTQEMVGKTANQFLIRVVNGETYSGTLKPELLIGSETIPLSDGDILNNPTNHIAKPIITLTGNAVIPNLLDLEKPYGYSLDIASTPTWDNQYLNNIGFQNADYNSRWEVTTDRQAGRPADEGASITAHVNSTGTLTFKPYRWVVLDRYWNYGVGRGVTLTPDTDYTISCTTTSGDSEVQVIFYGMESPQYTISEANATRSGAGTLTLSFHTPPTCNNVLIIFYRTDNTQGTFSNIMLNVGSSPAPFVAFSSDSTDTFTVNDTTLTFTHSGFDTAVIDCEKENFTVDGVNYNARAVLTDQYGNYATDFICLAKGTNTVSFTSNIASAVFEPRFWEL